MPSSSRQVNILLKAGVHFLHAACRCRSGTCAKAFAFRRRSLTQTPSSCRQQSSGGRPLRACIRRSWRQGTTEHVRPTAALERLQTATATFMPAFQLAKN